MRPCRRRSHDRVTCNGFLSATKYNVVSPACTTADGVTPAASSAGTHLEAFAWRRGALFPQWMIAAERVVQGHARYVAGLGQTCFQSPCGSAVAHLPEPAGIRVDNVVVTPPDSARASSPARQSGCGDRYRQAVALGNQPGRGESDPAAIRAWSGRSRRARPGSPAAWSGHPSWAARSRRSSHGRRGRRPGPGWWRRRHR